MSISSMTESKKNIHNQLLGFCVIKKARRIH